MPLQAPLQMPTLRIELDGIKQSMVVAIAASQGELQEAIRAQLKECLATLTPEEILSQVRLAFDAALHEAVQSAAPELVRDAVSDFFERGPGADIVREAIRARFKL